MRRGHGGRAGSGRGTRCRVTAGEAIVTGGVVTEVRGPFTDRGVDCCRLGDECAASEITDIAASWARVWQETIEDDVVDKEI